MDSNVQQPWGRAWWGDDNPQSIAQSWAAQPTQRQRAQKELEAQQQLWQGLQNSQQQKWQTGERVGTEKYGAEQAGLNRGQQTSERLGSQQYGNEQRLGSEAYGASQAGLNRAQQVALQEAQNLWQTGERTGTQGYGASQAELNRLQQAALQASQQGWQTGERTGQNQYQTDTRLGTGGGGVEYVPPNQGGYLGYGEGANYYAQQGGGNRNPNTMGTQAFQAYMQQQASQQQSDTAEQQRMWQLFLSIFGGK